MESENFEGERPLPAGLPRGEERGTLEADGQAPACFLWPLEHSLLL